MKKAFQNAIVMSGIFLASCNAWARVDLLVWQPTPTSMRLILPQIDGESGHSAYERYLKTVNADPDLLMLFHGPLAPELGQTSAFPPQTTHNLKAILLANDRHDMSSTPTRMNRTANLFAYQGADVFALPIAAESGLTPNEASEFRNLVASKADLVIGLGGGDIDPRIYGKDNLSGLSLDLHPSRDLPEARLWQAVLKKGHAYVVGICRSHQMILSLLGYKLVQDIESQLGLSSHRKGEHSFVRRDDSYADFWSALTDGVINTIHHQGFFRLNDAGPVKIVATDENGITEMTVFKNARGATFQFHPELMSKAVAEKFAEVVYKNALKARTAPSTALRTRDFEKPANRCAELFKLVM